ncbi:[citrate (pro-3S)-lyase] ligase [Clostridium saccharobutylicum]|uniref:[Citrate [pro-3S]-lyase] ligase n=1 Tax=Clostridium saccharobutylicum DSM 13864 TaxID=1345695 RepID=U5MV47_CLOSA|nr:[citrate (pro-3S)-lyase] ligase [Clostridium saccharobutylicum]AGX44450.1 [citrate [pro-3S]-lyase] ligase CitC [Clostridium saccharobutylicum DSM 13864]AQR91745.1 [citrate [pro-3S]-lyase] ligase [Clostridium saccharobutylicum]AQS01647.1 [citrate [pro-3S]-lyase] ligase [Clostridium saccharobutylicum]AQS11257.1 [citrate [pro-3S]-lyase] ligase [Clostridium saccharobutylicum]AQS15630.1 [citrate [pro-3S]-lyase] ligase [Clostridium saccharobutylicum]
MEYLNLEEIIIESNDYTKINEVQNFLIKQGLRFDNNIEYTVALYDNNKIIATGSFDGRILKCIAVDEDYKGMGISNKIVSTLINEQYRRGNNHLFVYTKPSNYKMFEDFGFYKIEEVPNKVILLENDSNGIWNFLNRIRERKVEGKVISSVVVNCNPFTLGHRYLIEKASRESDIVHVFVVSEDKSVFTAKVRYQLVEEGLKDLKNVAIHAGEEYIISSATFPSYFIKKLDEAVKIHTLLDIKIFLNYIVPALGINRRYVGEEPSCEVTKTYNDTMKEILPSYNVEVIEVPRICIGNEIISASRVRKLIKENKFLEVKKLIPESTYEFLISPEAKAIINKI